MRPPAVAILRRGNLPARQERNGPKPFPDREMWCADDHLKATGPPAPMLARFHCRDGHLGSLAEVRVRAGLLQGAPLCRKVALAWLRVALAPQIGTNLIRFPAECDLAPSAPPIVPPVTDRCRCGLAAQVPAMPVARRGCWRSAGTRKGRPAAPLPVLIRSPASLPLSAARSRRGGSAARARRRRSAPAAGSRRKPSPRSRSG